MQPKSHSDSNQKPNLSHTRAKGAQSERLAVRHLESLGLRIVQCNVRAKFAEIDIIAKDGDCLCFIEVRSRGDDRYGVPEATVGSKKQFRIVKAASLYLQKLHPNLPMCRFDVLAITGFGDKADIRYFKNAFGADCIGAAPRFRGNPWQVY